MRLHVLGLLSVSGDEIPLYALFPCVPTLRILFLADREIEIGVPKQGYSAAFFAQLLREYTVVKELKSAIVRTYSTIGNSRR